MAGASKQVIDAAAAAGKAAAKEAFDEWAEGMEQRARAAWDATADAADRATDPLQGGGWRRYKPWIFGVVAASVLVGLALYLGRAHAEAPTCRPLPIDLRMFCHPQTGTYMLDSDEMPTYLDLGIDCVKRL